MIPAATTHPLAFGPGGRARSDHLDRSLHIGDALQPNLAPREPMPYQMNVRVGESGDSGAATQVDAFGASTNCGLDFALRTGGDHAPVANGDRLDAWLGRIERVDRAIVEDDVWHGGFLYN